MNITMPDVIGDNNTPPPPGWLWKQQLQQAQATSPAATKGHPPGAFQECSLTPPPPLKKTLTSRDFCCSYGRRIAPHLIHTPTPPKIRP